MSNNDLPCRKCNGFHHPVDCPFDGVGIGETERIKQLEQELSEAKKNSNVQIVEVWMKKVDALEQQLSTHQAMLEKMAGALRMVKIANHCDVSLPTEQCLKDHFVILLPTEDDDAINEVLEEYQTMKKGAGK